jgi:hypothetical protein
VLDWPRVIVAGLTDMLTVGGAGGVPLFPPPPPPQACNARATAAATAGRRSRVRKLVMIADMLLVLQWCYGAGTRACQCSPRRGTFMPRVSSHLTRSVARAIYSLIGKKRRDEAKVGGRSPIIGDVRGSAVKLPPTEGLPLRPPPAPSRFARSEGQPSRNRVKICNGP